MEIEADLQDELHIAQHTWICPAILQELAYICKDNYRAYATCISESPQGLRFVIEPPIGVLGDLEHNVGASQEIGYWAYG